MYSLYKDSVTGIVAKAIIRSTDNACTPFDPANTDYQQFKTDVLGGAELQDAEGGTMTQEQANDFIATLP